MEIKIIKSSMDILRKQYKHIHLSEEQVKNLVQDSWDAAEAQQAIIYDENNTAAVFCLCLDNIKRNAVFIHLSKHPMNGDWNAWRVYFRALVQFTPLVTVILLTPNCLHVSQVY